ncbi:hypothetical protein SLEP1_g29371 [Rubroshorea leprosula]|nr:hypothetical protein SLEP1_g29371 [Rubroshorea leprosula]
MNQDLRIFCGKRTIARRGFVESKFVDDFSIVANVHGSKRCILIWPGGNKYEVMEDDTNGFVVDLENRKCTCRSWDLIGIPCKHAVTAPQNVNDNEEQVLVTEASNPPTTTEEQQLALVQQLALAQQPSKRVKLPIRRSSSSKVAQTPPLDGTLLSEATLVPSEGDIQTHIQHPKKNAKTPTKRQKQKAEFSTSYANMHFR